MQKTPLRVSRSLADTLIARGFATEIDGMLIPTVSGADPAADSPFPAVPEDIAALETDALEAFATETAAAIEAVAADAASFVNEARSSAELLSDMEASVEALESARAELASRTEEEPEPEAEVEVEPEIEEEPTAEELAAEAAALASRVAVEEPEVVEPEVEPEPVVAAAAPARRARPSRSRTAAPQEAAPVVSMVAAAGAPDLPLGYEFPDELDIAKAMIKRKSQFGIVPEGLSGKEPIARASWSDLYPPERTLSGDEVANMALIAAALDPKVIRAEMNRRKAALAEGVLVASGGLCAPVTPYYQLQMISQADRPVRGALPAFNADRGGIRFGRPAALSAITTGVGTKTAAEDEAGGSEAEKTCQVVACPDFEEVDVEIIYHCLQFGNLGARTFPERVAQFNSLVLAAHARTAESILLTGIDTASTQVTAGALGLGASATLFSQILAAANGMRNRNRMDSEAVLRLLMPDWAIDLIISDVIRGQFQRFDTDEDKVVALLRSFDIEPTFYIDGANGRGQVFGSQPDGALLPFPENVVWYLYPEGSFLYTDGGVLELGLVRDSILNKTNDFQIFGESFENVAFVGVESLAVESPVCDSGTVSLPASVTCPIDYTPAS